MQNMAEAQVKRMKQRKRGKDRLEEAKRNWETRVRNWKTLC